MTEEGQQLLDEAINPERLRQVMDTLAKFPADKFKVMFLNWWAESEHAGWDGFAASEILSFYMVVEDFATFIDTLSKEDLQGFFTFGSHTIDASSNGDPQ